MTKEEIRTLSRILKRLDAYYALVTLDDLKMAVKIIARALLENSTANSEENSGQ